jgi:hypothetical protein
VSASHIEQADQIRRQMSLVRRDLAEDVEGLVLRARQLTDWRHYVRSFPWAAVAAAAAAGYFVVPRKVEVVRPDPKTLATLAKHNRLVVEQHPPSTRRPGVLDSVLSIAGNLLLRAGLAYVGQQVGRLVGQHAAEPTNGEVTTT